MTIRFSILAMFILLAGGCRTATVKQTVVSQFGGASEETQLEFWHRLNDEKVASNDDAFHAVLLYVDGQDAHADYMARVNAMKSRNLVPQDFDESANQAVQRGTLAVALVRAMQIRGGLMLHLFGPSPRYAVRELYFQGIYPLSSPHQTFSGSELVGIIGRVEDYQRGNPAEKRAALLPAEQATGEQGKE
jgi:hypothetical protein